MSLQLNRMLAMRKIQQAKQDDAEFMRRIHPAFIPVTGLRCSYGKISQPVNRDPGWKNRDLGNRASPPSQMNTSKILLWIKVRRDLGNGAHVKRSLDGLSDYAIVLAGTIKTVELDIYRAIFFACSCLRLVLVSNAAISTSPWQPWIPSPFYWVEHSSQKS